MKTDTKESLDLKNLVKERYSSIAESSNSQGCCGPSCGCSGDDHTTMAVDYSGVEGYMPDADLSLGCGLPTELAGIRAGHTVVDLGSGAGNDCFVARSITGPEGKVIGVDFTPKMIERARKNLSAMGFQNMEFRLGEIENLPLADNTADVVISNCVLNLVPDKGKAFQEIFRILKPGGHFSVSDIVLDGAFPAELEKTVELYTQCVSGAIQKKDYLGHVIQAGFIGMEIQKEREIQLPLESFADGHTKNLVKTWLENGGHILSINLYGKKPV